MITNIKITILGIAILFVAGCSSFEVQKDEKVTAEKRWQQTASKVKLGIAKEQFNSGKYDQAKAARIDQLQEWAEVRDLKLMLAIWAHPYLRTEGKPWDNGSWYEKNPYSEIVEVEEFYTDSRAMGIWELINDMHRTSGRQNPADVKGR
jgi:hypothetical protein